MRILIANDDGVGAAQLPNLIRWCQQYGEVTTVVPKVEQSGKSHGIELHRDLEAKEVEQGTGYQSLDCGFHPCRLCPFCCDRSGSDL